MSPGLRKPRRQGARFAIWAVIARGAIAVLYGVDIAVRVATFNLHTATG
jgi:hypothetical protein